MSIVSGAPLDTADPRLAVLYDEDCGFCRWSLDKLLAWDRRRRLRPVAIQSDEGQDILHAIPPEQHLESWHVRLPSGEVLSSGAAGAPVVEQLPLGRPLAALFRTFPRITERAYRWVARNRNRFARLLRVDASCEIRR
jgi:predicted DCC family thiol-disulfide oxidoreductase YuxK